MNLHGIVSGAIGAVNPNITGTLSVSTGYTVANNGKQIPAYDTVAGVRMQIQPMTFRDLQQTDGLNLQGTRRGIYLYGVADGVVRALQKGGDLIVITSGVNAGTWLIAMVLEQWPDWCKVAATLQNGA